LHERSAAVLQRFSGGVSVSEYMKIERFDEGSWEVQLNLAAVERKHKYENREI